MGPMNMDSLYMDLHDIDPLTYVSVFQLLLLKDANLNI
jgi:hypothetical protein